MEHRHQSLPPREYTVGWVCALPIELAAAEALLDEEHESLEPDLNDDNLYTFGTCCQHNVVIAGLPAGRTGNNSAAAIATRMKASFRAIRFILLVGIGGGVPSADHDIRLGDVVISQPAQNHGGVVQYDFGKEKPDGFERTGCLDCPPTLLLNAVTKLKVRHARKKSRSPTYMNELRRDPGFKRNSAMVDVLYEAEYNHVGKEGQACHSCSEEQIVKRELRNGPEEFVIHYGTIASGNKLMRDAVTRDRVSEGLGGVLCFEMEAAGLMNIASCLVIRGVCDYADSHKNKRWQEKTQIAVEFANRVKKRDPKIRIFWVIASSVTTFIQSYRDIAEDLKIPTKTDSKADEILHLVHTWLKKGANAPWFLIIDSNDDAELLHSPQAIASEKFSRKGIVGFVADILWQTG
ncbi:Nucleoside phosphorylase domain protein, partial [Metarhizium majus ARSEF 297]